MSRSNVAHWTRLTGRTGLVGLLALGTVSLGVAAPACSHEEEIDESGSAGALSDVANARAILEIHPLDIWAQELPADGAKLRVSRGSDAATFPIKASVDVGLTASGSYRISLEAPDHDAADIELKWDGTTLTLVTPADGPTRPGVSVTHGTRRKGSKTTPVHAVYVGLRHQWFSSSGRPARRGNDITLLQDGEEAWGSVAGDLRKARTDIRISTWWWESNFELVRSDDRSLPPETREAQTILGILKASAATKRVLVGQFWGQDSILSFMTTDSKLRAFAEATGDKFEFMGQANTTSGKFHFKGNPFSFVDRVRGADAALASAPFDAEAPIASTMPEKDVDLTSWPVSADVEAASYHQKFMSIDSDLAYVGGMNLRRVDWDQSNHAVFNPKRMLFDATQEERDDVAAKNDLPDLGPRKDYMVRIHGPSATDVSDVFLERWNFLLDQKATYADKNSRFDIERNVEPVAGGKQVQVTTTLPQPFWEHSIGESWLNAVGHAKEYIYIEDQYFRMPIVNAAIAARMVEVPTLKLIVVTKPVSEWTDPGCAPTAEANAFFQSRFADRYMLLKFTSFATSARLGIDETKANFVDIDTHSKMLIVDDRFMSVGSANKNNRGILYEGEMNVAILDDAWVKAQRRRIFANVLPQDVPASDVVQVWWDQMKAAAAYNGAVAAKWDAEGGDLNLDGTAVPAAYIPKGLVYPLVIRAVADCAIESIGPDMVDHEGEHGAN